MLSMAAGFPGEGLFLGGSGQSLAQCPGFPHRRHVLEDGRGGACEGRGPFLLPLPPFPPFLPDLPFPLLLLDFPLPFDFPLLLPFPRDFPPDALSGMTATTG
jgi:hypothetical protein